MDERTQSFYPLFADLKGKKVVLVGGGRVAARKAEALLAAGADLTVISPQLSPGLEELASEGRLLHVPRAYRHGDLEEAWLAVAATDDAQVQKEVYQEACQRRIFCNVVDQPDLCSFIVPSQVRRGELVIAISTGGRSPALAKAVRKELEERYPPYYARYIGLLGKMRDHLMQNVSDPAARREKCLALADPRVLEWLKSEKWDNIRRWMQEICGDGGLEALLPSRQDSEKTPKRGGEQG